MELRVHTKTDEERGHGLVLGHVDQPSAQTEVREDQQDLLHDVIDVGNILWKTWGCRLKSGFGRIGVASETTGSISR